MTCVQDWWVDKNKTGQGGCQKAYGNTERAAGLSGKHRWLTACDNNLLHSLYVWTKGAAIKGQNLEKNKKTTKLNETIQVQLKLIQNIQLRYKNYKEKYEIFDINHTFLT